jgi:hypothetical protein
MPAETTPPERLASLSPPDGVQQPAASKRADDVVDWDLYLPAPPRPQGTVQVHLVHAGRSRPLPVDDPASLEGDAE